MDQFQLEDGCVVHCMGKPAAVPSVPSPAAINTSSFGVGSVVTPPPVAAASNNNSSNNTSSSSSNQHPLKAALEEMKKKHSDSEYNTALTTIAKLLSNIINKPMEEKYRKVKRTNPAFTKRLGRLSHSHEAMTIIGFVTSLSGAEYDLIPSADAWPKLTECKTMIDEEIRKDQQRNTSMNNIGGQPILGGGGNVPDLGFGGIPPPSSASPGFGGTGLPNMNPQMMESVLSNPAALQTMMSNPMVQQMIMNDPRLNSNPMMQNAMRTFMNNPNMIQQMSQMMNDPTVRSRMSDMMAQQQGLGGNSFGAAPGTGGSPDMAAQMEMMRQFTNMASSTNNGAGADGGGGGGNQQQNSNAIPNQQSQQNQTSSNNDGNSANNDGATEMTEEEMIEAAIARSLREQ